MLKILLPTDGSPASQATLQWASRFLRQLQPDVTIHLLIVAESLDIDLSLQDMETILSQAQSTLRQAGYQSVQADYRVNRKAPEAICRYANEHGVDQIIIGSHGRQLAQRLLGSVSQSVLEHANQPVLMLKNTRHGDMEVREPQAFHMHQPEHLKVLLPVVHPDTAKQVLAVAGHLLSATMTVHLLHVVDVVTRNPDIVTAQLEDAQDLVAANRTYLNSQGFQQVQSEARLGGAADEICRYADEQGIDQVVMAAHDRPTWEKFLFGSVSQTVLHCAKQPVLLFKPGEKSLSISHSGQVNLTEESPEP